jgi:peptidoglycan hydrolase-like protein with peptidoglycan-binding domain
MENNKLVKYVVIGVPLLIGGFFLYKYFSKPKGDKKEDVIEPIPTSSTTTNAYTQKNNLPFKKGDKSGYVKAIQRALGITQDGKFGSDTEAKVKEYQKSLGLKVDGIVGANTWKSLFNADFPNEKKLTDEEIKSVTNPNAPNYITNPEPPKPTFVMSANNI